MPKDSKFKIVPLAKEHLSKVAKIHEQVFREIGEDSESAKRALGSSVKGSSAWVAVEGDAVRGYAVAFPAGKYFYFAWLGVSPKFRKAGMGSALIRAVEAGAKRSGAKSIMLDSRNRFREAIRAYLKQKYDVVGVWSNTDGETMVRLRKWL